MNTRFAVEHFAQFETAEVVFKDLTVLVGPQATGKSLLLQLFKAVQDGGSVLQVLKRYGFAPQKLTDLGESYFGEGLGGLWHGTRVQWGGTTWEPAHMLQAKPRSAKVFYLPAQRTLIFHHASWPRPFSDFRLRDPFVMRFFSEEIRQFLEGAVLGQQEQILFPPERKLPASFRRLLDAHIFRGTVLKVIRDPIGQRRLMLELPQGERLPFLSWSTGQREFIPLLLGLYRLLPWVQRARRAIGWVVIEEPEMGLHPRALGSVALLILELLRRGYKVIVSTHSADMLSWLWARSFLQSLPQREAIRYFHELFALPHENRVARLGRAFLEAEVAAYYFRPRQGARTEIVDISTLEALTGDEEVSEWGGLTEFATRVEEIVDKALRVSRPEEASVHGL